MSDIESFKQETFALIRDQATKIKGFNRQMEIKDEQIRFLKDTIQSLEDERDEANRIRNTLKNKLDVVMSEVSQYNETVVKKMYTENEEMHSRLDEVSQQLESHNAVVQQFTEQITQLSSECKRTAGQLTETVEQLRTSRLENEKLRKQVQSLKSALGNKQQKMNELENMNEKLTSKTNANTKQIDSLVSKCQDIANSYEKKIKQIKQSTVNRQQLTHAQATIQTQRQEIEQANKKYEAAVRSKSEIEIANKMLREKQVTADTKRKIETALLEGDIRCLKESIKMQKRIFEYESTYSQDFSQIAASFFDVVNSRDQLLQRNEYLENRHGEQEEKLQSKKQLIEELERDIELQNDHMKNQVQSLQASYENKIMQLSIKIKKEEKAIRQLSLREKQFEALSQQYEALQKDHECLKQTFENTQNQYKKQNQKLVGEVKQLLTICDQQLSDKNSVNSLKHTLHNLLAVIHFLHLNLLRAREQKRKLFMPFIEYYFRVCGCLESKRRPLSRVRKCVWMVVAMVRMAKKPNSKIQSSGLMRYAERAISTKSRIEDVSNYLDELIERALENEDNCLQLLSNDRLVYRWMSVANYMRVSLPYGLLEEILRKRLHSDS